jgi:uncharacterized oligopeptide transporter (OPT) family protein
MIGSVLSIFVSAIAYNLYTRAYAIPGPQFPAPTAYVWLSFARLIGSGGGLPDHTKPFIINAAVIAALTAGFKVQALSRGSWWAKWIPSGVAFAIGEASFLFFSTTVSLVYFQVFSTRPVSRLLALLEGLLSCYTGAALHVSVLRERL